MNKKELISLADYTDWLCCILKFCEEIKIVKIIFLAFCLKRCMKKEDNLNRSKYEITKKTLANLRPNFLLYNDDFFIIIEAIKILEKNEFIKIENNIIKKGNSFETKIDFINVVEKKHQTFFDEVNKMDDAWFLEEIVLNV